jgi:hypothetical protein
MISATLAIWNPYNPNASATLLLPWTYLWTEDQALRNWTARSA